MTSQRALDRIEKLVWILIYSGMGLFVLGLAVRGSDPGIGLGLCIGGAVVFVSGVLLLWARSRLHEDEPGQETP